MNVYLSVEEQAVLIPCSPEAFRLYVAYLRPHMDLATGLVGITQKISYARLALEMKYQPPPRSHRAPYLPTIKQIRGLVDELAERGVLKRYSIKSAEDKQLVLLLTNALQIQARPEYEGQMRGSADGQSEGQAQRPAATGSGRNTRQEEGQASSKYEGHISEHRSKASHSSARGTAIASDFTPDAGANLMAQQRELDVNEEAQRFIAHFEATGEYRANWQARFRKWLLDSAQFIADRKAKNAAKPQSAAKHGSGRPQRGEPGRCV